MATFAEDCRRWKATFLSLYPDFDRMYADFLKTSPRELIQYGRWITIGAKDEDGKRKGGSPVYVDKGRITKGHPSLTGKKIDALDERGEGQSVRGANKSEKEYGRASWAKKARQAGIRPADLHQLAADILAHDAASAADREAMLKHARSALDYHGGAHRIISAAQGRASGRLEDATSIRGIDQVAEQMAMDYPHLFAGSGAVDDQLFEMLATPAPSRMTEDDAYEQAMEIAKQSPQAEESENLVPFARRP
ncbi:MAG TPA: hypothetical protein VHR72_10525 [Gemmataceae bacterium]|jgi:hypothetical protein|nr:hypothetical protein [Gemmataceae bacterium]